MLPFQNKVSLTTERQTEKVEFVLRVDRDFDLLCEAKYETVEVTFLVGGFTDVGSFNGKQGYR